MNKWTNPIDHILLCCEQGMIPSQFDILNAKDQVNQLRKELEDLKSQYKVCGWGRINDRGDLYDLRVCLNSYLNSDTILPVYANTEEYKIAVEKLKSRLTE